MKAWQDMEAFSQLQHITVFAFIFFFEDFEFS